MPTSEGKCRDFLRIETLEADGVAAYDECGPQGKQTVEVEDRNALVTFETHRQSLTERGFLLFFEGKYSSPLTTSIESSSCVSSSSAVGPGCHDIVSAGEAADVTYTLTDGVLHANVTCPEGHVLSGSDANAVQVLCEGETWSDDVGSCIRK